MKVDRDHAEEVIANGVPSGLASLEENWPDGLSRLDGLLKHGLLMEILFRFGLLIIGTFIIGLIRARLVTLGPLTTGIVAVRLLVGGVLVASLLMDRLLIDGPLIFGIVGGSFVRGLCLDNSLKGGLLRQSLLMGGSVT
jgi:hypothetical protein